MRQLTPQRSDRLRNLKWGLAWGLAYAVMFSAFIVVMAVLRGSTTYPHLGVTTETVVAVYFVVGLAGGAMLGLLRPLLRYRLGVAFVGWIVATIVYTGAGISMDGWGLRQLAFGSALGALVGPLCAFIVRRQWRAASTIIASQSNAATEVRRVR